MLLKSSWRFARPRRRQGAWLLIVVGVLHLAALVPLPPLSDSSPSVSRLPLGPAGAVIHYGWLRGCGSADFALDLVLSGQVIGHFGIVVIVWLNAALLAARACPDQPAALVSWTVTFGAANRI